ncbi:MAG: hypothetical protein LUE11_00880 [Clostridia bacterium]|nr:hypothetical protein [Clostridia bacterium]
MKSFPDVFKWCLIPYAICTVCFLCSPSLRLSKVDAVYQDYGSQLGLMQWMLDELKFWYVIRGYLLVFVIITLLCCMIKWFRAKTTAIVFLGTGIFLCAISAYTEFPTLGQVGLVWSNDNIAQSDLLGIFERYQSLLMWLRGWLIVLAIMTIALHVYRRLKPSA